MLRRIPGVLWAPDGGTGTSPASSEGTQPDSAQESKAGGLSDAEARDWRVKAEKRGRTAAVRELLSELEIDSIDDLRATVTGSRSTASEAEKLQRELKKLAAERDAAVKTASDLTALSNAEKGRKAIYDVARHRDVNAYEEEVHALLRDQVDVDEDGDVFVRDSRSGKSAHGQTVEKLVKQLVADRKHLLRATPGVGAGSRAPDPGNGNGTAAKGPDPRTAAGIAHAALEQLRDKGLLT